MKKQILILFICFTLLSPIVSAGVQYFPPSADWTSGYSAGAGSSSADDTKVFLTAIGSGAQRYYVTNALVDLSEKSYIEIDWSGSWTLGSVVANASFGISTQKTTPHYYISTNKTATFSRTTTKLDVSDVYGSYYIKFSINITGGPASYIYLYMYTSTGYNHSDSYTMNVTSVDETTATLNGYLDDDSGLSCESGFWVSNLSSVNEATKLFNFSAGSNTAGAFSASATGLNSSEYYYVRSWSNNSYVFNYSSNVTYFLTKPDVITNFHVSDVRPRNLTLNWTYPAKGNHTNQSVLIRYSKTSYPTSISGGTFGANISAYTNVTINGLEEDTAYYFSAWTYINCSGSPFHWHWSDSYAAASNSTQGGIYNISVRYENESVARGNMLIDLSQGGPHKFTIHYLNETDYVIFNNGIVQSTYDYGYYNANSSGWFNFTTTKTPIYIEFNWNNSETKVYRCNRIIVPTTGQKNITFYVRTNLHIYGESTTNQLHTDSAMIINPAADLVFTTDYDIDEVYAVSIYNISTTYGTWETVPNANYSIVGNTITIQKELLNVNTTTGRIEYFTEQIITSTSEPITTSLVKYFYTFIDETGKFKSSYNPIASIYTYNKSGTRLMIHSEFFSADGSVNPYLVYGEKYFIGVSCTLLTYDLLGIAPAGDNLNPEVRIPFAYNLSFTFYDMVNVEYGWTATGIYVHYQDTVLATSSVQLKVYYFYNYTLAYTSAIFAVNDKNFTWSGNTSDSYAWEINVTMEDALDLYTGTYTSGRTPIITGMDPIANIISLDYILTIIFGPSPIVSHTDGSVFVPWSYLLIGTVAFIVLTSLGKLNSFLGGLGAGAVLTLAGIGIVGMQQLYTNYGDWWHGPVLAVVGFFLMAVAIVGLMGGVDNR